MEEKIQKKKIKLGIGFATGRKNFRKVLNSYIYSWNQSKKGGQIQEEVGLSLFVAYDITYSKAQSTDFTNLNQEMVDAFDEIVFLGAKNAQKSVERLIDEEKLSSKDAKLLFSAGYAGKRNAILYAAIESDMDYLLFLDDDEYPVAVTSSQDSCLWSGQYVLPMHLQNISQVDITNGHHCGYISPIPYFAFDESLTEKDFKEFIETISNDIISWTSIKKIMEAGGVTYADKKILQFKESFPVEEVKHCKFISGSNLCINLTRLERVFPFYNPPGARGEDTFLSTLLSDRDILRIPCYTFHDGFSAYRHLLDGVLPICLSSIPGSSDAVITRFYNACIGWVRYKPLLVYITDGENYEEIIKQMRRSLEKILPKLCAYFNRQEFVNILDELNKYSKNVKRHHQQFLDTQEAWKKLLREIKPFS